MRTSLHREKRPPLKVRLWDLLTLETQMALIQAGLVDQALIVIANEGPGPFLLLMEDREELERLMKEKPKCYLFQGPMSRLRGEALRWLRRKNETQDPASPGL